jgi:hypothetical protein
MEPGHDLGRRIKEAREARGATLSDIAATTKISSRALAAIEREAFDDLPHGIFRRAWVRAFSAAVGLDGDALARTYVARFEPPPPEPPPPPRWAWSPPLLMGGVLALAGILVAAAAVLSWRRGGPPEAPLDATGAGPVAVTPAHVLDPPAPRGEPAALPGLDLGGRVRLRLETSGPSWISAVSDGERVVHRLVGAGEVLLLDAGTSITVRAGDAGAVSYALDGREPQVLGRPGQPLTVSFTAGDEPPAAVPPPADEAV